MQADLGQGAPVHVGTADVEVGLVHHPEFGVQDTMGQLLHVHRADLGTCNRQVRLVVSGWPGQPQVQLAPRCPWLTALQQGLQVRLGLRPAGLAHSDADLHTSRGQGLELPKDLLALRGEEPLRGWAYRLSHTMQHPHGVVLRFGFQMRLKVSKLHLSQHT